MRINELFEVATTDKMGVGQTFKYAMGMNPDKSMASNLGSMAASAGAKALGLNNTAGAISQNAGIGMYGSTQGQMPPNTVKGGPVPHINDISKQLNLKVGGQIDLGMNQKAKIMKIDQTGVILEPKKPGAMPFTLGSDALNMMVAKQNQANQQAKQSQNNPTANIAGMPNSN